MKGFDQTINIILDESHERVYSTTQGVEQVVLGLHIIRGDNVWVIYIYLIYSNIFEILNAQPIFLYVYHQWYLIIVC